MTKKLWATGVYLVMIIILIVYRDSVITWLEEGHTLPLFPVIVLTFLLAFFPVIPYGMVTGYLGSQYGWFYGGLLSFLCTVGTSIMLFLLTRYIFEDKGRKFLEKYKAVDSFTEMVERNAFFAVLIGRLIPILPSQAISVYSGLSSMSIIPYVLATFLGKIPLVIVYALVGDQIKEPYQLLEVGGFYALFLLIVYVIYRYWFYRIKK